MSNFRKYLINSIPLYALVLLTGLTIFTDNSVLRNISMVIIFIFSIVALIYIVRVERKERSKDIKEEQ